MKKIFLVFIMSCLAMGSLHAVNIPAAVSPVKGPVDPVRWLSFLTIKEMQEISGKKFTLKEKIRIKVFQWKLKKGSLLLKQEGKDNTSTIALISGIAGLALLLGIAYVGLLPAVILTLLALILGYKAKKRNPHDKKAKAAIILGWITVGLFVAFTIVAIAVLSSFNCC